MVNRNRIYSEYNWDSKSARNKFKGARKSHRRHDLDENCPECGSSKFAHWDSGDPRSQDYDWCKDCGYGRTYKPENQ